MSKTKKFVMEKGYYEILETNPTATTVEIQRSFERLCEEHVDIHSEEPDKRRTSAETLFTLTKAYDILTDPFQRLSYDERRFNGKNPMNNDVETIFKEGLRSFRANNVDTAIRFFKEAVVLFPHKTIYRVNLAIAYAEKGMFNDAKKELRMSLKLDPQSEFAKEVVAKVLFQVSDRKNIKFLAHKVNRQIALAVSAFVLIIGTVTFGIPKINNFFQKQKIASSIDAEKQLAIDKKNQLPKDLREAIDKKGNSNSQTNTTAVTVFNGKIPKLEDSFKPSGQTSDYSEQEAIKKTYYKDQNLIIVEYKNGSILTYKPQDLQGWKNNPETKIPVVITKGNEIIPVPTSLPVTMSDGKTLNPGDPDFPAAAFPEYGIEPKENSNTTVVTAPSTVPVNQTAVGNANALPQPSLVASTAQASVEPSQQEQKKEDLTNTPPTTQPQSSENISGNNNGVLPPPPIGKLPGK